MINNTSIQANDRIETEKILETLTKMWKDKLQSTTTETEKETRSNPGGIVKKRKDDRELSWSK